MSRGRPRHKAERVPTVPRVTPQDSAMPANQPVSPRVVREVAGLVMILLGVAAVLTSIAFVSPLAAVGVAGAALAAGGYYLATSEV